MASVTFRIELATTFGSFCFFILASFRKLVTASTPTVPASTKRKLPRLWLVSVQMLGNATIFFLSIIRVLLQTASTPLHSSLLFASLMWLVFCLALPESHHGADYEQYIPWTMSTISYIMVLWLTSSWNHDGALHRHEMRVQWARVATLVFMIASVAASPRSRNIYNIQTTKEDTHTLSMPSNVSEKVASGKSRVGMTELQSFRQRPWLQYIASFGIFLPYSQPHTIQQYIDLMIMILTTLVIRAATFSQPLMLRAVIESLSQSHFSVWELAAFVTVWSANPLAGNLQCLASSRLRSELEAGLRTRCYNHSIELSADYHSNNSVSSTIQNMRNGDSAIDLIFTIFFELLPNAADLVITLLALGRIFGANVAFTATAAIIVSLWSAWITIRPKMYEEYVRCWNAQNKRIVDSFTHWRKVFDDSKTEYEKARYQKEIKSSVAAWQACQARFVGLVAVKEIVEAFGFLVVCWLVKEDIVQQQNQVGDFVLVTTYWMRTFTPVGVLMRATSNIAEKIIDAERLILLLRKKPTVVDIPDAPEFVFQGGAVRFEHCSFAYPGGKKVINDMSFEVLPGQTIAFVGKTGSGKSTIFQLLCRYFDPSSGRILVDNQDIREVQIDSYRAYLSVVHQSPEFFDESIQYNVKYWNLAATDEEVNKACKMTQLHMKIQSFPNGYHQRIGETGHMLSGGENQRLAMATMIFKNAPIILLDEVTSQVDSITEHKIQSAIEEFGRGKTKFVIAHRLSTVQSADQILVVHDGQIVEHGKHQELLDVMDGHYRKLWMAQFKGTTFQQSTKSVAGDSCGGC